MKTKKSAISISFLVIALGVAWLLNEMGVIPGVDMIWPTCLGVSGILMLAFSPFDRFTFVVGTSLIVCSVLSVLRQTEALSVKLEAPVLFITVGILSLLSQVLPIPATPKDEPTLPPEEKL